MDRRNKELPILPPRIEQSLVVPIGPVLLFGSLVARTIASKSKPTPSARARTPKPVPTVRQNINVGNVKTRMSSWITRAMP